MKKITLVSSIVIASLYVGCGGGGSSESAFKISSNSSLYSVAEGMNKDIVLGSNRENITFKFVDKTQSPTSVLDRGILTYRAPQSEGGADQSLIVKGIEANGNESAPLTLSFHTVDKNMTSTISVLKISKSDTGIGKDRNFAIDSDDNVIDPYGNIWENTLEGKSLESRFYFNAANRCEIKRLMDKGSNWRVPTTDELLNLVDYSKVSGTSMLDDAFDPSNMALWAESDDGRYQVVSQINGLTNEVGSIDKYPVRCINSVKSNDVHIVSTERLNRVTHDLSTGLMWSPMSTDLYIIDQNASEYCASYDNASGWRLPNINEIRSIVEHGNISSSIMRNYTMAVSSTPYNNSDSSAELAHYLLVLGDNKTSVTINSADVLYKITCVKKR